MSAPPFNEHMMKLLEIIAIWRPSCRVLDGGCGDASTSLWLARQGCNVLGVDINLKPSESVTQEINHLSSGNLALINADLLSLEPDQKFDAVALFGLLHYLGSHEIVKTLIKRTATWLVDDGLAVISWITNDVPLVGRSAYLLSKQSVRKEMLNAGFRLLTFDERLIEHSHGEEPHQHNIAYSTWILSAAANA